MPENPLLAHLQGDETLLDARWQRLVERLGRRFGKAPGVEGVLFLVGIQGRGRGFEPELPQETKEALIMEGTWRVFERLGVYERVGMEADGSWIWERVVPTPPGLSVEQQEHLLKIAILRYFDDELAFDDDPDAPAG